jgi:hypothetical protein
MGARNGRVVTTTVWALVRPATRWMRVVSMASARVMAGRLVVSRRASIDVPARRSRSIAAIAIPRSQWTCKSPSRGMS